MTALALPIVVAALALATAWATAAASLPLWARLTRGRPRLARATPIVAAIPWLIGAVVALAAVLPGDPHLDRPLGCHCAASMPTWLHLCPIHPGAAAALAIPAALVLALLLPARISALAALAREPRGRGGEGPVPMDLSGQAALLVGWWAPTLVVDRAIWGALAPRERQAILAHERGHLARRDPLVLMALRALLAIGPRAAGDRVARAWLARAEARADHAAAREVGDPLLVASTLLRCARLGARPAALAPAWTGGRLEDRVQALLDAPTEPAAPRPDVGLPDALLFAGLGLAGLASAPWLHHQVEHLINLPL